MTDQVQIDRIGYVILFVKDMAASLQFYRDKLGTKVRFEDPNWTELEMQGLTLALHLADPAQPVEPAASPEVVFSVDDVLGTRAALVKLGLEIAEPKVVHDAGDQVAVSCIFRDPDGHCLAIYGMVPRGALPGA